MQACDPVGADSRLELTELRFVKRIFLASLEFEIGAWKGNTHENEASLLQICFHSHGIWLCNAAFADHSRTSGADT